jgi:hypothetical protein
VTKSDLRCFMALAGILPIIRYACTCRFNTLGAILITPASVQFCLHACFWCDFDCTSECAILIASCVLVGLTLLRHVPQYKCQHASGACQSHFRPVQSLCKASRNYTVLSHSTQPFLALRFCKKDLLPTLRLLRVWLILPLLRHILSAWCSLHPDPLA